MRNHVNTSDVTIAPDTVDPEARDAVMRRRGHRHWRDLTPTQQRFIIAAGIVQVGLATAAWVDLARRPAAAVRGSKGAWAAAIAVNFAGPIAYFVWGRRDAGDVASGQPDAQTQAPPP